MTYVASATLAKSRGLNRHIAAGGAAEDAGDMVSRETLELVRAYYKIRLPTLRGRIFRLVKALSRAKSR